MFEGFYMDDRWTNPRLERLAREVGAEIPLPPLEKENGDKPKSLSPLLDALRNLLQIATRRA